MRPTGGAEPATRRSCCVTCDRSRMRPRSWTCSSRQSTTFPPSLSDALRCCAGLGERLAQALDGLSDGLGLAGPCPGPESSADHSASRSEAVEAHLRVLWAGDSVASLVELLSLVPDALPQSVARQVSRLRPLCKRAGLALVLLEELRGPDLRASRSPEGGDEPGGGRTNLAGSA